MNSGDDRARDQALVLAAQQGDREALNTLLTAHYDRLYAVCRRLANNDADAADATQEALMAIVRGLPGFDGRSLFRTWSYRVATNACLDELRRRGRRPDLTLDDGGHQTMAASSTTDHDRAVQRMDLETALTELSDDFRAPVVLRDVGGFDYAEISEILGIRPGTVRSRIARGRRHLIRLLGEPDEGSASSDSVAGPSHGRDGNAKRGKGS